MSTEKIYRPPAAFDLNREYSREMGALLQHARETQGLTLSELANSLTLSAKQVSGLETGSTEFFYGARFFAHALNKYADHLGVVLDRDRLIQQGTWLMGELVKPPAAESAAVEEDEPLVVSVEVVAKPKTASVSSVEACDQATSPRSISVRRLSWVFGGMALVTGAIVIAVVGYGGEGAAVSSPGRQIARDTKALPSAPVPVEAQQASSVLAPVDQAPAKSNTLRMAFDGTTWVQAKYRDGKVLERTYGNGESADLDLNKLVALTIGNAPAASLMVDGRLLNMEAMSAGTRSNVLRLGHEEIQLLARADTLR